MPALRQGAAASASASRNVSQCCGSPAPASFANAVRAEDTADAHRKGICTVGLLDSLKQLLGRGTASATQPASTPDEEFSAAVEVGPDGIDRRVKSRVQAMPGTRVLVIDDSPTIVALLRRMLLQNGFEVLEAGDAEAGLAIARSGPLHLVFLDIVLPGMNGFEALRRLRREPGTRDLPVIMISGNELATEQFYAQRIGADDFMKKPFSRSEVFHRIEKLLGADRVPHRPAAITIEISES